MSKPAIVYAAAQGHVAVLELLLGSGIDINAPYEHR